MVTERSKPSGSRQRNTQRTVNVSRDIIAPVALLSSGVRLVSNARAGRLDAMARYQNAVTANKEIGHANTSSERLGDQAEGTPP